MQADDMMISKLLSLRFYDFTEGDRRGLTGNIRGNTVRSTVSEAARIYLKTAVDRNIAEPGHLSGIADWLESWGNALDRTIVSEYRAAVSELTLNTFFQRGACKAAEPSF
jgi:hypothetical protein